MKHRGRRMAGLLVLLVVLTGCGKPAQDVIAQTDRSQLRRTDYEQASVLFQAMRENASQDGNIRAEEGEDVDFSLSNAQIFDQIVYEWLVAQDDRLALNGVDARTQELYQESVARFEGEEGLDNQLGTFGINRTQWMDSLRKLAQIEAHKKAVVSAHPISTDQMQNFYKKDPNHCAIVKFVAFSVSTRDEAQKIVDVLTADPAQLSNQMQQYQNDPFSNTSVTRYEKVGYGDASLLDPDILAMSVGEAQSFALEEQGRVVVFVEEKILDFGDLQEHIAALMEEEQYAQYVKGLEKRLNLRIYPQNMPSKKSESSEEDGI